VTPQHPIHEVISINVAPRAANSGMLVRAGKCAGSWRKDQSACVELREASGTFRWGVDRGGRVIHVVKRAQGTSLGGAWLADLLQRYTGSFALLHRPGQQHRRIDVLCGPVERVQRLHDLVVQPMTDATQLHQLLVLVPFRQIMERGFACHDDGAPLLAMSIRAQRTVNVHEVLSTIPDGPLKLGGGHFDVGDDDYAKIVKKVVKNEIGSGEGSNFVICRSYVMDIADSRLVSALRVFRRLLEGESETYWTFLIHTPGRTFVGASPEQHISLSAGIASMNPMSGTYRYPPEGPSLDGVVRFLRDRKEIDELYMVVEEELKMMARICPSGVHLVGPRLRQMSRLAHTEYFIKGHTHVDAQALLRETMFAPTVVGSPLESAFRVISRYETRGRGYYGGVVALIGRDAHGALAVDSSIMIRTAEIDSMGHVRISVGATLVRHSRPESEVHETTVKAAGLLRAFGAPGVPPTESGPSLSRKAMSFRLHDDVRQELARRNTAVAKYWRMSPEFRRSVMPELLGRKILVVDAEDTFAAMLAQQLRSLGLIVTVSRFDDDYELDSYDAVVIGAGPGDPRVIESHRMRRLHRNIESLVKRRAPFIAVCLGHQMLCGLLGLDIVRLTEPNQGVQREIDLFGRSHTVGFYNAFCALADGTSLRSNLADGVVDVSLDLTSGQVAALRCPWFYSFQFHPESLLTRDGPEILGDALRSVLDA